MNKYHYVYRITNKELNKHYYGVRSSKVEPKLDLGVKYFSSSSDKNFINEQKENKKLFKYKVIKIFETRKDAINLEIKLHDKFNVGINESFYNKVKQITTGFCFLGKHLSDNHKLAISKAHIGKTLSNEHKDKLKISKKEYYKHNTSYRIGKNIFELFKNPEETKTKMSNSAKNRKTKCRVKHYILISPDNNKIECVGNLKETINNLNLSLNTLKSFKNKIVPIVNNYRVHYNTKLRQNTTGWSLIELR